MHLPTHASWRNQIESSFSIIQRKVLTLNDFPDLAAVEQPFHPRPYRTGTGVKRSAMLVAHCSKPSAVAIAIDPRFTSNARYWGTSPPFKAASALRQATARP
jgi:hypothetical protein